MLKVIINKELADLWRDGRVKWFVVVVSLLFAITIVTSYRYSRHLQQEHAAAMQADRQIWDTQPDKNPHGAAHFGFNLFKPVHPLSIFEPGIDRYTGATLFLEAHKRNSEQFSAIADQSDLARMGFLSPSFILQFLIPLLIIVGGFNAVSNEKENKNLSLLLSQGCTATQLLLGKWLSLFVLVAFILVPVFFISIAALVVQRAPAFNYLAAMGMLVLYLLFYAVIINIVLVISSRVKHSGHAFLYCIFFWIVSSVLAPRLVSNLAQQTSPLLTKDEIVDAVNEMNKRQHRDIHALGGSAYKALVDSLLIKYHVDSVSQLPVNMAGIRLDVGEQMDTRNYDQINMQQLQRLKKQQLVINAGSIISPLIPSQQISMAIANTDLYSHQHFTNAAEQYRREFVNIMNRYIAYESKLQEGYTAFKAGTDLWKRVPVFTYRQPGLSVLTHYLVPVAILLVWLLISSWLLNKSLTHFKPI